MDETPPGPKPTEGWTIPRWIYPILILVAGVGIYYGFITPPDKNAPPSEPTPAPMQTSRTLVLAMFQYAQDNGGRYPTGKSSTDVFQQLLDGNYISDPSIFYLEMTGKVKAQSKQLAPENVAYDVTTPVDDSTPDQVPVVFATGYRIEYKPGGSAIPRADSVRPESCKNGIPVCYHSNVGYDKVSTQPDGTVTNFIPANAQIGPGPYTQLTPEGPLPAQ
jgi:hypothetical protein